MYIKKNYKPKIMIFENYSICSTLTKINDILNYIHYYYKNINYYKLVVSNLDFLILILFYRNAYIVNNYCREHYYAHFRY